jgi:hypothetical protein
MEISVEKCNFDDFYLGQLQYVTVHLGTYCNGLRASALPAPSGPGVPRELHFSRAEREDDRLQA